MSSTVEWRGQRNVGEVKDRTIEMTYSDPEKEIN